MDLGRGQRVPYPPVRTFIDQWGERNYVVQFRFHTETILIGDGVQGNLLSEEEGIQAIYQKLRESIQIGNHDIHDFPDEDDHVTNTEVPHAQPGNMQRYYAAVDGQAHAEEQDDSRHRTSRMAASAEAVTGLKETTLKEEGDCSVCLMDFDANSKLRMMPCSHYFHEQCIFTWLRRSHVCPLCRFPLPTEKQQ